MNDRIKGVIKDVFERIIEIYELFIQGVVWALRIAIPVYIIGRLFSYLLHKFD